MVGEQEVRLLFTNRALAQAETASGLTIMRIVTAMSEKDVSYKLLVALLQAGMEAARRDAGQRGAVSPDDAWSVLEAVGYSAALVAVATAVVVVFSWDSKTESDAEADRPPEPVRNGTGADS